jgi:uncharacterized protein
MKHSSISYIEAGSHSASASSAFFSKLFNWQMISTAQAGEGYFETPTCRIGHHGNDPLPGLMVFFAVDDIEEAAQKVVSLGGTASDPSAPEDDFGRFCMCKDPQGISFGLHQKC